MSKFCFIDLETTGTSPYHNAIHQIAGLIEIDGVLEKEFNFQLNAHEGAKIDMKALEISGISLEDLESYEPPALAFSRLKAILQSYVSPYDKSDKFYFLAFNAPFDDSFLRAFWRHNRDNFYGSFFSWPAIDIAVLAAVHLMSKRNFGSNFKLETVCRLLDIDFDPSAAHDALYDIRKTRELFHKVKGV